MTESRPFAGARRLVLCIIGFALVSCGEPTASAPGTALANAESRWKRSAPPVYSMEQYRDCFCGDHGVLYLVEVANGQVRKVTNTGNGQLMTAEQRQWFHPVTQLFEDIRTALNTRDATVDVEYDPVTGVPTRLWIDPSPQMADEEFGYRTGNIHPLPD